MRRLLADAHALIEPVTDQDLARVKRQFVIRAPDGMSVIYGAALAVALMEAMPEASLRFLPESHADATALREGRIDLDMGSLRLKDPEAEWDVLQTHGWVGAARAGHPVLDGKLTARRLAAEPHVAIAVRQGLVSPVDEAFTRAGHPRRVTLTVPNAYGALVTIARSPLVGCVPARIAHAMHGPLGLTLFDLPFPVTGDPFVMAWHPRQAADPAHLWLRQAIRQVLEDPRWQMPRIGAAAEEAFVPLRRLAGLS